MKGSVSFVNIRAHDLKEISERLEFADLIYIVGGAQLVLPQLFKATGFDTLLAQLAQTKVIMGTSAGANVLGRHIEDPGYWQDQYGSSDQYLANPYLGLVDFNILPHFERADHPLRTTQRLTPLLKEHTFLLYGVTDTQAVVFNNGATEFLGGKPVVFGNAPTLS
jgi:peptidase E